MPAIPPPPPVQLTWEAPKGCPSADTVSATIARLLAESNESGDPRFIAQARVYEAAPNQWRVQVVTDDGVTRGARTLSVESCQAAADTTAFVVVLAVASARARTLPDLPPPAEGRGADAKDDAPALPRKPIANAPPPNREPKPTPIPSLKPAEPPPRTARPDWLLGVRILGALGELPSPTAGLGIVAGVRFSRFRLDAGAEGWLPRDILSASTPGAGATFRSVSGQLRGCYGPRFGEVAVSGCVGARLSRLSAEGFGAPNNFQGAEWHFGPLGAAILTWQVSPHLILRLEGELSAQALHPHTFVLFDGEERAYRAPRFRWDTALGFEVPF